MQYRTSSMAEDVFYTFWFEKNLQGDIVAVYNSAGTKLVSYTYDAWGNFTITVSSGVTTLERLIVREYNPFHYRSYYFDAETEWYYLQSRYYNPEWGRFINADGLAVLGVCDELRGYNLFAYCANNPIMAVDYTGYFHLGGFLVGLGLAVAGGLLILGTGGAATPVVTLAGYAILATGVTMAKTAALDEAMVIDLSISSSESGTKTGACVVFDFDESTYDIYHHGGYTATIGGGPITYSVGTVFNYDEIGDYGGEFVNVGITYNWLGVDYCRAPDANFDSAAALSLTFGLPGINKFGGYVGWDYYVPIKSGKFAGKIE